MASVGKGARRRFGRRIALALGATLIAIFVATVINLIGIRLAGSVGAWDLWFDRHWAYFLLWRLGLYGLVAYAWWRMRRRIRSTDDGADSDSPVRLRRVEIAAVCTIVVLESITWIQRT